jgi:hypothetical protein
VKNQERRLSVSLYLDEVPYYSNYLASGLIHGSDYILHGSISYMKGAQQESIRMKCASLQPLHTDTHAQEPVRLSRPSTPHAFETPLDTATCLFTSAASIICKHCIITLWLFNIAMENGPFIDDFPINTSISKGCSMAMLNNQRVYGVWGEWISCD